MKNWRGYGRKWTWPVLRCSPSIDLSDSSETTMKDLRTAELRDEIRLRKALNTVQSASRYTSTFNETTADKLSV